VFLRLPLFNYVKSTSKVGQKDLNISHHMFCFNYNNLDWKELDPKWRRSCNLDERNFHNWAIV